MRMTPAQERLICEARRKGAGYKAIASATGLDRDAVRYYCKRHGLDGGSACPNCGRSLTQPQRGRRRRFCGEACRRAWWAKHPEAIQHKETALYTQTCQCCGKQFTVYGNSRRRYCGHACYISDRFRKGEPRGAPLSEGYLDIPADLSDV